jgi:hypothetical protein
MIRVLLEEKKGNYKIIAVAEHQKDLNNLRLMSYRLRGGDKLQLNKDKYGGQYIVLDADTFKNEQGAYNLPALKEYVERLQQDYQ